MVVYDEYKKERMMSLGIFESCLGRPINMKSVLDGFKVGRLAIIQEKIEEIVLSS